MYYDKIKYKRQQRKPEKDFYDYTLEIVPISQTNTRKQYSPDTLAIVGEEKKSHKTKIQSILVPRPIEEIKQKIAKKDIFYQIAMLEKEDFPNNNLRFKVKYNPYLSHEALAKPYEDIIEVGNLYFEMPIAARAHVLRHETGHMWEHNFTRPENYWQLNDSGIFGHSDNGQFIGILGTYNLHESVAESFSYYIGEPGERKFLKEKHPKAYEYIKQNIKNFKWM